MSEQLQYNPSESPPRKLLLSQLHLGLVLLTAFYVGATWWGNQDILIEDAYTDTAVAENAESDVAQVNDTENAEPDVEPLSFVSLEENETLRAVRAALESREPIATSQLDTNDSDEVDALLEGMLERIRARRR